MSENIPDELADILAAFEPPKVVAPAPSPLDLISDDIDPAMLDAAIVPLTEKSIEDILDEEIGRDVNVKEIEASFASFLAPRQAQPSALDGYGDDPVESMAIMGITQQSRVPPLSKPWMKHHEFAVVKTIEQVNEIIDTAIASGKCSLDLETEGLDNRIRYDASGNPHTVHKVVGFCLSYGDGKKGFYIPVRHFPNDGGTDRNVQPPEAVEAAISRLCHAAQPVIHPDEPDKLSGKKWLEPPRVILDFWNAKFDQEFLYPITGIDWWHPDSYHDGYLACYVQYTDDKALGLKPKSAEKLRDPEGNPYEMIEIHELFMKGMPIQFHRLSPDEEGAKNYGCSDGVCTRLLGDHPDVVAKTMANKEWARTYRIEKQTTQVVRVMERNRVKVDRDKIKVLLDKNAVELEEIRTKIIALAGSHGFHDFEPNSPKQLGEFLFEKRGLDIEPKPGKHDKSGQWKTDGETLEALIKDAPDAPEVLKWVVDYRGCEKLRGTYLEGLYFNPDENGELRFDFKQTGTQTARFTAPARDVKNGFSGIPIHGIPSTSDLRTAFVARYGFTMVKADYAGEELRIVTNLSGEIIWIKEFLDGTGDLHSITARAFFGKEKVSKEERKMGKVANFALVYGGGPHAVMRATGCNKIEAARRKSAFDKSLPTFAQWVKKQKADVKKTKGVFNAFGRWIAILDANIQPGEMTSRGKRVDSMDANAIRAACERHSINFPIQSSGSDIMKIAMILLHKEFWNRRWLRTNGDDSIRMLLTVHDEVVFEIRHDRVPEALEIICERMSMPGKMVDPRHSPPWRVPLVVEPLIGTSWGGDYDYGKMKHGTLEPYKETRDENGNVVPEKLKSYEIRVGDRIFHRVPPWLEPYMKMGHRAEVSALPESPRAALPPPVALNTPPPAPPSSETIDDVGAPDVPPRQQPVVRTPPPPPQSAKPKGKGIVTIRLDNLTPRSVRQVRVACAGCWGTGVQGEKRILRLTDVLGNILIDPSLGILVSYEMLIKQLQELNLTDGSFEIS